MSRRKGQANPRADFNQKATLSPEETARRQAYLERLEYGVIRSVDHPKFGDVYALFGSLFHTEGEPWVTRDRFAELFRIGNDAAFRAQWGALSHEIVYARDPRTGQMLGGAIYTAMVPPEDVRVEAQADAVCYAAYIFTHADQRSSGLAKRLIREREKAVLCLADAALGGTHTPRFHTLVSFNEQNDPWKMTLAKVLEDYRTTGMWAWGRLTSSYLSAGWQWLAGDFNYIDPGSPGDEGSKYLRLNVKGETGKGPLATVPTSLVRYFLQMCAVMRRPDRNPGNDLTFREQCQQLLAIDAFQPVNDGLRVQGLIPSFMRLAGLARKPTTPVAMHTPIGEMLAQEELRRAARRTANQNLPGRVRGPAARSMGMQ